MIGMIKSIYNYCQLRRMKGKISVFKLSMNVFGSFWKDVHFLMDLFL